MILPVTRSWFDSFRVLKHWHSTNCSMFSIYGWILKNVDDVFHSFVMNMIDKTSFLLLILGSYHIKDPQLQSFASFKNLEKFTQEIADAELLGKIKLVQLHGHSIVDKIKALQEKSCTDLSHASTSTLFDKQIIKDSFC
jgi:hypothetical protein